MQRYIDFLDGDWKEQNEFGKKEGYIASCHVFAVNNPRSGEPDLILAIEYKDYYTNARQLDQQKRLEAFLARDARKLETGPENARRFARSPAASSFRNSS